MKHAQKKNHPIENTATNVANNVRQASIDCQPAPKSTKPQRILPAPDSKALVLVPLNSFLKDTSSTFNSALFSQQENEQYLQRSLGCQTRFEEAYQTQEIACQTRDLVGQTNDFQQLVDFTTASDDYMNMIIADISTQTQLSSFAEYSNDSSGHNTSSNYLNGGGMEYNKTESREIQTSHVALNTTFTQTSLSAYLDEQQSMRSQSVGLNLEFAHLDEALYMTGELGQEAVYANGIDFMAQTNMGYGAVATSSQTDELYFAAANFNNAINTNSIQTQTSYFNNNTNNLSNNDSMSTQTPRLLYK